MVKHQDHQHIAYKVLVRTMTVLYGIMSLLSASRHQKKFRGRQQGEWKWTTEDQHAWAQCEKNQAGWNSNSWERKPTSTPASSTKDSSISSQSIIPYQLIKQEWTPDIYAYTWHHLWQSISVDTLQMEDLLSKVHTRVEQSSSGSHHSSHPWLFCGPCLLFSQTLMC